MTGSKTTSWILAAAIFAATFCGFAGDARGQDPTGVWDVSIGGTVTGLGRIVFFVDGTIDPTSYVIIRPTRGIKPANIPAGLASDATPASGGWSFDSKGKSILGFLSGGTSSAPYDMSFTGKAKTGSKSSLSLSAKGSDGTWKITGVPATDDGGALDGTSWAAQVTKDGASFVEIFTMTSNICPDVPPPPVQNLCVGATFTSTDIYELYGAGPGYLTQGYVLVGGAGKIGLGLKEYLIDKGTGDPAPDGITRIVTGKLSGTPGFQTILATGADDNHTDVKMKAFEN